MRTGFGLTVETRLFLCCTGLFSADQRVQGKGPGKYWWTAGSTITGRKACSSGSAGQDFPAPLSLPIEHLLAVSLARHDLHPDVEGGVDSEIGFLGFSLRGRHPYLPEESKVIYGSKDDKDEKVFDALE